jgi:hypothetical protein
VSAGSNVLSDPNLPQTSGLKPSLPLSRRKPHKKRQDRIAHAQFSDTEDEQTTEPENQSNEGLPDTIGEYFVTRVNTND